jgi:lysozyme family protein
MDNYSEIFNKCMVVVLDDFHEGGGRLVNSSSDKGGVTRWGIASASHPDVDIINLTQEQATDIYYKEYWTPMKVESLSDPNLILNVFDHGITSGPQTSIKLLQRLVQTTPDGGIGPITIESVSSFDGDIVDEFKKRRKLFYITIVQRDESQRPNLAGWLRRVDHSYLTS